MAWITKNSAGATVDRPAEALISAELRAEMAKTILPKYEILQGAMLPVLHEVQHEVGYLPLAALIEVAEFLEVSPQLVLDTATFYDEFHLEPIGKYSIGVCQSITCEACGQMELVDYLREKLGIEPGETTADGLITFQAMECLGSCDTAPCGLFDTDRRDNLTIAELDEHIDRIWAENVEGAEGESSGVAAEVEAV